MKAAELALRRRILTSFAATGAPPALEESEPLRRLAEQRVVVLDDAGRVVMAHPFAAHRDGARVDAGDRTWWGNCAWDGLGIVAALRLPGARITANGAIVEVRDGRPHGDAIFHVLVAARHWWDDIAFT